MGFWVCVGIGARMRAERKAGLPPCPEQSGSVSDALEGRSFWRLLNSTTGTLVPVMRAAGGAPAAR